MSTQRQQRSSSSSSFDEHHHHYNCSSKLSNDYPHMKMAKMKCIKNQSSTNINDNQNHIITNRYNRYTTIDTVNNNLSSSSSSSNYLMSITIQCYLTIMALIFITSSSFITIVDARRSAAEAAKNCHCKKNCKLKNSGSGGGD
ncbi:hypothetical protein DERF_008591, partial [Dermatophagoides farinae]